MKKLFILSSLLLCLTASPHIRSAQQANYQLIFAQKNGLSERDIYFIVMRDITEIDIQRYIGGHMQYYNKIDREFDYKSAKKENNFLLTKDEILSTINENNCFPLKILQLSDNNGVNLSNELNSRDNIESLLSGSANSIQPSIPDITDTENSGSSYSSYLTLFIVGLLSTVAVLVIAVLRELRSNKNDTYSEK